MSDFTYFIEAEEVRAFTNDLLNFARTFQTNKFFRFQDSDLGREYNHAAKNLKAAYTPIVDHAGNGKIRIIWKGKDSSFQDFVFDFTEVGNDVWMIKIADHY